MAWDSFSKLPSTTLNRAAGVSMLAGLFALGIGIGSGGTLLTIAAGAVIFVSGLVPAAVDCRDAKRRHEPTARPEAPSAVMRWRAAEWNSENIQHETSGDQLVWFEFEPERQRLH